MERQNLLESEYKVMGDTRNPVSLRPFAHQVGGHSNFQQFDNHTVCKPLFSKELKFYQEIPSALKPFIPQFKGEASQFEAAAT